MQPLRLPVLASGTSFDFERMQTTNALVSDLGALLNGWVRAACADAQAGLVRLSRRAAEVPASWGAHGARLAGHAKAAGERLLRRRSPALAVSRARASCETSRQIGAAGQWACVADRVLDGAEGASRASNLHAAAVDKIDAASYALEGLLAELKQVMPLAAAGAAARPCKSEDFDPGARAPGPALAA